MGAVGPLGRALRALKKALEVEGTPYMLIGGVAVIARGVARTTRDVDATVPGPVASERFLADLARHRLEPRISGALAFARRTQVLLLRHVPSSVDVDLTLAWAPFETEALAHAEAATVARMRLPVARAEDLVVYKLVGGRPIDLADIEELLTLHGGGMDHARLRRLAAEIAEALDAPDRAAFLEAALRRQ